MERVRPVAGRALALCLGIFTLLNLAGEALRPGFDATELWLDLRPLPRPAGWGLLLLSGAALLAHGFGWRSKVSAVPVGLLAVVAAANTSQFYLLLGRGLPAGCPVPFSALVLGGLAFLLWDILHPSDGTTHWAWLLGGAAVLTFLFPLFQILCFGNTDYRRPADVAVVLGAKVYPDGTLSDALGDRMSTACELWRQGLAPRLLLSGGAEEVKGMRAFALAQGIPPESLLLDPAGLTTEATVENSLPSLPGRVLVVSHFYHLPRIKMAYRRFGREVWTVPSPQRRKLTALPWFLLRECAALWSYYLRPLSQG